MTFAGLAMIGTGTLLVWAAITGENPITAAGNVLRGRPPGSDPIDLSDAQDDDPTATRRFRGAPLPKADPSDSDAMTPIRPVV